MKYWKKYANWNALSSDNLAGVPESLLGYYSFLHSCMSYANTLLQTNPSASRSWRRMKLHQLNTGFFCWFLGLEDSSSPQELLCTRCNCVSLVFSDGFLLHQNSQHIVMFKKAPLVVSVNKLKSKGSTIC